VSLESGILEFWNSVEFWNSESFKFNPTPLLIIMHLCFGYGLVVYKQKYTLQQMQIKFASFLFSSLLLSSPLVR
jgi:hypothetical protein